LLESIAKVTADAFIYYHDDLVAIGALLGTFSQPRRREPSGCKLGEQVHSLRRVGTDQDIVQRLSLDMFFDLLGKFMFVSFVRKRPTLGLGNL